MQALAFAGRRPDRSCSAAEMEAMIRKHRHRRKPGWVCFGRATAGVNRWKENLTVLGNVAARTEKNRHGHVPGRTLFGAVCFGMLFCRMLGVIQGVQTVSVRYLRVMSGLFVVACGVMLCRFGVMMRSLRVMISCVLVMIRCFG
jgi:hypothetical protein